VSRISPPTAERPAGLGGRVRGAVRTLNPGYLALVMATGIISVAMSEHGVPGLSLALLWLAAACYVVLVVLYAWRLVSYRADVGRDLRDPARAFGFFTIVAGTDVLGTRLAADGRHLTAFALLAAASAAWLVLVYLIPWLATLNGHGHVLAEVNGTWFIWAVSTQSLAVLSATLEPTVQTGRAALAFLAVFCWSVGIFLYGAAAVFVAARILSYGLSPRDLTPPYWVAMGATAITVLAGARIAAMASAPAVDVTRHLIAGFSVLFWAFGTWLFPALIAAGVWRHTSTARCCGSRRCPPRSPWRSPAGGHDQTRRPGPSVVLPGPRVSAGRGCRSGQQQFVGQGVGHGGRTAGHFELDEDVLDMVLGGAPADVQGLADVWVGGAVGEQPQHLELARAEGGLGRIGGGTRAPLAGTGLVAGPQRR